MSEYQGRAGEDGVRANSAVGPPMDLKMVSMSCVLRIVVSWYRVVYGYGREGSIDSCERSESKKM